MNYKPKMLLYGMGDWSHGRVYTDIVNEFSANFNIDYINWWQHSHDLPWRDFAKVYDLILIDMNTVLEHLDTMFAPDELQAKILPVIHGPQQVADYTFQNKQTRLKLYRKNSAELRDDLLRFKLHACVSPNTVHAVAAAAPELQPRLRLTPLAVSPHNFPQSTFERNKLTQLGYFTHLDSTAGQGMNTKRGHLAQKVSAQTGVPLVVQNNTTFRVMDLWYQTVDVYLMTSIYESGPLPLLEAGVCGIPIIASPAGFAPQFLQAGGGVLTETFDETEYVTTATHTINYWRRNPAQLNVASKVIRENTLAHHTWNRVHANWCAVFEEFIDVAR